MTELPVVEQTPKRQKPVTPPEAPNPEETKGKRGRKPGVPPKERQKLPANAFRVRKLTTEESRANAKRKRQPRSDDQKAIDKLVLDSWKEWIESGEPTNWVDMPITEWPIPLAAFDDGMFYFRNACTLYGRKPIFGDIREEVYEGERCMIVPFCVITRPPKRTQRVAGNDDST